MKLYCIGTSHGKPEKNRKYTGMLLEVNGSYYVVDAGTSIEEFMINQELPVEKIKGIFITHAHADHIGAIPSLLCHIVFYRGAIGAKLYLPEKRVASVLEEWLEAIHLSPRKSCPDWKNQSLSIGLAQEKLFFEDENIKVWGIRTDHIPGFETFAYLVEAEGKKVLFTGDLSGDMHDYPFIALKENLDAIVCELTHMRNGEKDGLSESVIEKLRGSLTKRFIFNHVHPQCEQLMNQKYREELKQRVEIARDGDVFEI